MTTAWYVSLLAPIATLVAVFLTHHLTIRREANKYAYPGWVGGEHYRRIAEYIAGLRHQRLSEPEVNVLAGLFPQVQALRRQIELRVRGERFVLGAAVGGAILSLVLYLLAGPGRTVADDPAAPAGPPAAAMQIGPSGAVPGKARCPELVVAAIGEATNAAVSPMAVELSYASGPDRAYVCTLPSGRAYYFGMKFLGNTSSAIALPATPHGDGFQAVNGKTVYYVEPGILQVRRNK
jgi:hypothetical protein